MAFRFFLIVFLCAVLLFPFAASAHPGKTDENGGHYDYSTGEYHYHHGYPAHQHENGVCPYDFDDKTDHSASENTRSVTVYSPKRLITAAPTVRPSPAPVVVAVRPVNGYSLVICAVGGCLFFILVYQFLRSRSLNRPELFKSFLFKIGVAVIIVLFIILLAYLSTVYRNTSNLSANKQVTPTATVRPTATITPILSFSPSPAPSASPPPAYNCRYIAHYKSKMFHVPTCETVSYIPESSREYLNDTREELIEKGYSPCQRCHP